MVAMALSGYTDEKNSLWREMCSTLRLQLNNPYLCVMFAFLTSEAGAYDGVLYENKVAVRDRVAFACKFLGDAQGSPLDVLKDERVQYWIENYRNLLDAWRFWHKRAEFDIHRSKLDPSSKPLAQVAPNQMKKWT